MQKIKSIPEALAEIAKGRDYILTSEFAKATNRASQTIRKNYCLRGECFGVRPLKFGNCLLWSVLHTSALLNGETPSYAEHPAHPLRRSSAPHTQ